MSEIKLNISGCPTCCGCGCGNCTPKHPQKYRLTATGFIGSCAALNEVFELECIIGQPCRWYLRQAGVGYNYISWEMYWADSYWWQIIGITAFPVAFVRLQNDAGTDQCNAELTFTVVSGGGSQYLGCLDGGGNCPGSVTIERVIE